MLANFSYLLASKSITLYILYTLHVILGTSLVFTALYTYGVHSSKAMARAAALEASMQTSVNGISMIGKGLNDSGSAVEFEEEMDELNEMNIAIGGLDGMSGMRKAKSVVGLSTETDARENKSTGIECGNVNGEVKFREICYGGNVKEGAEMNMPMLGEKGVTIEIS
ncbi:hypothetical protein DID88_002936 [Monilinia fructigena]|uniref:Uncharacterized protein n=1 Tax=Monilinia fructigena TaxID=38457 RepID=A0A395IR44_9HELO|nr:hypothetical protein DID88_002936 [Monilinia fructigena]